MASSLAGGAPLLVLGASSTVGGYLLQRLAGQGVILMAVSRRPPEQAQPHVIWLQHDLDRAPVECEASVLVSLGPLAHALDQVRHGARLGRVVALSSASPLFKARSPDPEEEQLMARLIALESDLEAACKARDIHLTVLKPTLIYGHEQDGNISRIGGLAGSLKWLPYCGRGKRHPVHADDLARLVIDCLGQGRAAAGSWLLGGGEVLDYPDMLARTAGARNLPPRLIRLPLPVMRLALACAHAMGRLKDIQPVMLARQRVDLLVDDTPAREQLGWSPRGFRP